MSFIGNKEKSIEIYRAALSGGKNTITFMIVKDGIETRSDSASLLPSDSMLVRFSYLHGGVVAMFRYRNVQAQK